MFFLSLADACRRLGIDVKTLRRWLAHAQLPLQSHPRDGRKKGVSSEHLQLLARLHHRRLAPLPQESPALVPSELPLLPAELLALPETLCALQAQLAALQQQVADLTHLLQQHAHPPTSPVATAKPAKAAKHAPPAPRSHPAVSAATKLPRKPSHVIPRVESGSEGHYVVICPKQGLLALSPDTPAWFAWVATQSSFRFVGKAGSFSAHHEGRIPNGAWRAHRHIRNQGYTLRLAPSHDLTMAVLEQAAEALQAHLT